MIIGFSTGANYKNVESATPEAVDLIKSLGCNAIEIMAGKREEVDILKNNLQSIKNKLVGFEYISFHAPCVQMIYDNNKSTRKLLTDIELISSELNFRYIVFHPDQILNWSIFGDYKFKIAVENLGSKHPFYRAYHMKQIFEDHPDIKMVLDVNHSYRDTNDTSISEELYDEFKDRIVEVHVSGYLTEHDRLADAKNEDMLKSMPKEFPIIIESFCDGIEKMKEELEYIKKRL